MWKKIVIVPEPSCPGRELFSSWWFMLPLDGEIQDHNQDYFLEANSILPFMGLLPVRTPWTFLQIGHCRKGEVLVFNIWFRQSLER